MSFRRFPFATLLLALAALTGVPSPARGQAAAAAPARGPGGIVAIVNQDVITRKELDRRVSILMEQTVREGRTDRTTLERDRPRFERAVLDLLIEQRLLLQDAKKHEIATSEAEIDAEIARKIEQRVDGLNVQDADELYKVLLENWGYTQKEFRDQIRDEILVNRLLWTKYFLEPFVTPGERREYYRAHSDDFQTASELSFYMIIVDDSAEAPRLIDELEAALDKRPFEEVAREYYAARGEELFLWRKSLEELKGWRPPLPEILSRMKPGEVRRRIRTANGWRYIQMVEVKIGERKKFEDAQGQIVSSIRKDYRIGEKLRLVERLRKEAHLQDFLEPAPAPGPRPVPTAAPSISPAGAPAGPPAGPLSIPPAPAKVKDASPEAPRKN